MVKNQRDVCQWRPRVQMHERRRRPVHLDSSIHPPSHRRAKRLKIKDGTGQYHLRGIRAGSPRPIDAAKAAGVKHVVLVSSMGSVTPGGAAAPRPTSCQGTKLLALAMTTCAYLWVLGGGGYLHMN